MSERNINEELREASSIGDEDLFKTLINMGAQINSKNSMNGMTCLHWASLRNNRAMVKMCLEYGADPYLSRHDGKLPGELTNDSNIRCSLGVLSSIESENNNDIPKFIPNYLKNPVFPHAKNSEVMAVNNHEKNTTLIKVKLNSDQDFIEFEIEKFASFEKFKEEIKKELNLNMDIKLIRKLPNVLLRDERDLQRLKEGNELEIELVEHDLLRGLISS